LHNLGIDGPLFGFSSFFESGADEGIADGLLIEAWLGTSGCIVRQGPISRRVRSENFVDKDESLTASLVDWRRD
jgi:hypothetical protein